MRSFVYIATVGLRPLFNEVLGTLTADHNQGLCWPCSVNQRPSYTLDYDQRSSSAPAKKAFSADCPAGDFRAVIIKAHTPGANRKIILILDRYLANSSYENNNSYPI